MVISPKEKQSHPVFGLPEDKEKTETKDPNKCTDHRPGCKRKNYIGLVPPPKRNVKGGFPVMNLSGDLKGSGYAGCYRHISQVVNQIASYKHTVGVNGKRNQLGIIRLLNGEFGGIWFHGVELI